MYMGKCNAQYSNTSKVLPIRKKNKIYNKVVGVFG